MGESQRLAVKRPAPAVRAVPQLNAHQPKREHAMAPQIRAVRLRAFQPSRVVGAVDDPFEREAERTAVVVTGVAGPNRLQRAPSTVGDPSAAVASLASTGGGQPLDTATRARFEPRFGVDFANVRTHADSESAGTAVALGARAFTVGDHIFFGAGEFQPNSANGQRLLAHELTHTIQQQPTVARVQRDFFANPKESALATVREWADKLPPFELLTVLVGRDPITDKPVERTPRTWMHAALKLVPDGMAIFADLEKNKTIEKVAVLFGTELAKLNLTWDGVKA